MFTFEAPDLSKLEWSGNDSHRLRSKFGDGFEGAAGDIARAIQEAAPVRTGALRDSVRVEREGNAVTIKAGGTPETTTRSSKGAIYDRAVLTEYGTGKEAAEPFFYPAARGGKNTFDNAASNALKNPKGT